MIAGNDRRLTTWANASVQIWHALSTAHLNLPGLSWSAIGKSRPIGVVRGHRKRSFTGRPSPRSMDPAKKAAQRSYGATTDTLVNACNIAVGEEAVVCMNKSFSPLPWAVQI